MVATPAINTLPLVDLSPFFNGLGDEAGKKKAKETIGQACTDHGFFVLTHHAVPLDVMDRALDLSKAFFGRSFDEKSKYAPSSGEPTFTVGYSVPPKNYRYQDEIFIMCSPMAAPRRLNVFPENPSGFREAQEELFGYMSKTAGVVEEILNECLGLPPNYLKNYNDDRTFDTLISRHYSPASESEKMGTAEHQDGSCVTYVIQDDIGGLEFVMNGDWVPVPPIRGSIVVNVGDVMQVLSNKKLKSAYHRVWLAEEKDRYSFVFSNAIQVDKWVEPIPMFTKEKGEAPKYKGFLYKEYVDLRIRNRSHPPTRPEDNINIQYYAIAT